MNGSSQEIAQRSRLVNRLARQEQHPTDGATGMAESGVGPSDTGTAVPKFRLVLPIGQEPPPGYVQVGTRSLPMGDLDDDQLGKRHFEHFKKLVCTVHAVFRTFCRLQNIELMHQKRCSQNSGRPACPKFEQ